MKKDVPVNKYFETMKLFFIKYSKMKPEIQYNISESHLKDKINNPLCEEKLTDPTANFVKWVLA